MMKFTPSMFARFRQAAAVATAAALTACSQNPPPASASTAGSAAARPAAAQEDLSEIGRTVFDPSLGIHLDSMNRRASGLYVQDLVTGTGAVAARGRSVVVHYTGWLPNGKQFETSEITVTLGSNKTIRAWEEGLLGMRVGGKRRLVVPPNLGYGNRAAGDVIPANSVLIFEMEALSVF